MTVETAINLAENGYFVFPVRHGEDNSKTPLTPHGHLNASRDPGVIMDWWDRHPTAKPGVACGKSGILVVDVDTKNGKDGWTSLDEAWLDLGTPFSYETGTGGSHLVYQAPEDKHLSPSANYRGMVGVDVRAGESWVLWAGEVVPKAELTEAPEWAVDEKTKRTIQGFEGTIQDWYANLVPGDPNVMVRRAINSIQEDMGHSDMVAATYEAIRLGAEGCPGVPELIDALEEAWMNRPAENHTTPESAWEYKFQEALLGGLEKYGASIDLLKNLPEYNIGLLPKSISDTLVTNPSGKAGFSKLLGELVKETDDDNRILSILWNCPATKDLSREWGLEFTFKRIQDARIKPEPTRENPRIEEARDLEATAKDTSLKLLTKEEREFLETRPTFVDFVEDTAREFGWTQFAYFRAVAWAAAALAFSFKGFIPLKGTQKLDLNLWSITLGYSGSGKAQPLTSKVLTVNGFKPMGEVQVGDEVVVPSGGTALVSGVYPQGVRPVYTITFKDGRTVEADEDHLWSVKQSGKAWYTRQALVKTTKELKDDLFAGTQGKSKWNVETVAPMDLGGEWKSSIPPYVLGLLIGDGGLADARSLKFTCLTDPENLAAIESALPEGMGIVPDGTVSGYRIVDRGRVGNRWISELRRLGLQGSHSRDKTIPEFLLNSPAEDRIALLQGIMDTDGSASKKGHSIDFTTASENLRNDVAWLVRSLGGRATTTTKSVQLKTWNAPRTYFRTYATLPTSIEFFRLERKRNMVDTPSKYENVNHPIRSIEFKGYEPTQCIMVDHPDHEYVTDGFTRTHNTTVLHFRDEILRKLFAGDPEDVPYYDLGTDSSPQGLHLALLERDGRASFFGTDEASGFFKTLGERKWDSGLEDTLSQYYTGFVPPSNKLNLKELKGKSAKTAFTQQMFATPDRLTETLTRDQFKSGFLARYVWSYGHKPLDSDDRFVLSQSEDLEDYNESPEAVNQIAADLIAAVAWIPKDEPVALKATPEALKRLSKAYKDMFRKSEHRENWDLVEPSVTRLMESMFKAAGICALYREDSTIEKVDALHAIRAAEEWLENLHVVVGMISEGSWQKLCNDIEEWIRVRGGSASRSQILHAFRNQVKKDGRELNNYLEFLLESGILNREDAGGGVRYILNGDV